jgi:hypothetical protein
MIPAPDQSVSSPSRNSRIMSPTKKSYIKVKQSDFQKNNKDLDSTQLRTGAIQVASAGSAANFDSLVGSP